MEHTPTDRKSLESVERNEKHLPRESNNQKLRPSRKFYDDAKRNCEKLRPVFNKYSKAATTALTFCNSVGNGIAIGAAVLNDQRLALAAAATSTVVSLATTCLQGYDASLGGEPAAETSNQHGSHIETLSVQQEVHIETCQCQHAETLKQLDSLDEAAKDRHLETLNKVENLDTRLRLRELHDFEWKTVTEEYKIKKEAYVRVYEVWKGILEGESADLEHLETRYRLAIKLAKATLKQARERLEVLHASDMEALEAGNSLIEFERRKNEARSRLA
ncbi:hypothetical protein MMC10_001744 [Thelotrema lepadinum]|nr:hypothetical protein [Thelotrema lepadinum]